MAARKSPVKKAAAVPSPRPLLQWIMAGVGLVVTASAAGVILWEATMPTAPPRLVARIVQVQASPSGHVARVQIDNLGADTAAAVDIEGRLGAETATATVDYVPGHGSADARLRFDADPADAQVRVLGWSAP